MTGRTIAVALLLSIGAAGLIQMAIELRSLKERKHFSEAFLSKLKEFWESGGSDTRAYGWLLHRSHKMQNEMGASGIIHSYRPPYQNYMYTNYPIILNMIPELRKSLEDEIMSRRLALQYLNALQESLVRYIGQLDDWLESKTKDLINPVKWFREGIRSLVVFPVAFLGWVGLLSQPAVQRWKTGIFSSLLSGVLTIIGLVSGVMTIVLGWDTLAQQVTNLLSGK